MPATERQLGWLWVAAASALAGTTAFWSCPLEVSENGRPASDVKVLKSVVRRRLPDENIAVSTGDVGLDGTSPSPTSSVRTDTSTADDTESQIDSPVQDDTVSARGPFLAERLAIGSRGDLIEGESGPQIQTVSYSVPVESGQGANVVWLTGEIEAVGPQDEVEETEE